MNLLVVGGGDVRDKKTWSGTSSAIVELLEKKGLNINTYDIFGPITPLLNIIIRIFSKLFYFRKYARAPFLHTICKKGIDKAISERNGDKVLFISENIDLDNSKTNYYIYLDALLKPLLKNEPFKSESKKWGFYWFYKQYEKNDIKSYQNATAIFTETEWTKTFLINGYGIAKRKIYNIGAGVNLEPLNAQKFYDENLLLIVLRKGNERLKGFFLLRDAFRILRKKGLNVKLAVVGSEFEEEEGITYFYNQPRSVTVELFKKCTLYTMPALCEPNGVTYLESLANKSPIIGLNRYAFPEFCGYGKYGFICKDENAEELASVIEDALSDKERLARMGEEGQKFVMERYSWNKVVDKMLTIMQ